jgi:hypothetical protein
VRLLTEATQHYLETFCERLNQEQEREAAQGSGWPDILEKVPVFLLLKLAVQIRYLAVCSGSEIREPVL